MLLSLLYRLVRCLLGPLAMLVQSELSKDVELLVLRHENQVLRRQAGGRPRWDHADRLWFTALSRLVSRRRWSGIFPVTSATFLRWHRDLVARKWTFTNRRRPGRPSTGVSIKTLIVRMPAPDGGPAPHFAKTWGCRGMPTAVQLVGQYERTPTIVHVARRLSDRWWPSAAIRLLVVWSSLLDPSFFIGAVSAGVAAAMTWDAFKAMITWVAQALQNAPGPANTADFLGADGEISLALEDTLQGSWELASSISTSRPANHSLDEATAFHWILFFREFLRTNHCIRLRSEHYQSIAQAAAASPEQLSPSQLVARIIEQWLRRNPNASIGLTT